MPLLPLAAWLSLVTGLLFDLRATPEVAFEGGPVVLVVTGTYRSRQPIDVLAHSLHYAFAHVTASTPAGWKAKAVPLFTDDRGGVAPTGEMTRLKPGDRVSYRLFLHPRFDLIPRGQATLLVSWHMCLSADCDRVISPTCVARLTVESVTDESAGRLVALLREQARRTPDGALVRIPAPEDYVIGTRDPRFCKRALEMLGWDDAGWASRGRLALFLVERAKGDPSLRPALRSYLCGKRPRGATSLLFNLAGRDSFWSEEDWRRLDAEAQDPLVRALIHIARKTRPSALEEAALHAQLAAIATPLPPEAVLPLVRRLGTSSFAEREEATRKLINLGETAEAELASVDRTQLSADALKRLRLVQREITRRKPDPFMSECVLVLTQEKTPFAIGVLKALAQAAAGSSARQEATAALGRLDQR